MKQVQKEFPVATTYTYVNTAASGLLSENMLDYRQEHDLDFLIGGSMFREKQVSFFNEVRASVAGFFEGAKDKVALVPNFSWGMNALLEGLPSNSKVLLLDMDYPSINWPVESRFSSVIKLPITSNLETVIKETVAKEGATVFVFSIVQFINGVKIDLDFIKELKAEYPDLLLIADGTQYFGTEPFNFTESGIDVIGASAYKWMLGGYGCGFFMFTDEALKRFDVKTVGMASADGNMNAENISLVKKLEPGHLDTLSFGTMKFGIDYLMSLDLSAVKEYLTILTEKAFNGFKDLGLLDAEVVDREAHKSTIFSLKLEEKYISILREQGIITSYRGDRLRVSFHVYNTEKDVNKLLLALRKSLGK
ncbi:aminotransferase class V-fold PLP-dependent enzyme [Neptunitalea lumnitzerae]|uniref:Aminotransferase n=1 Tax=Neptunitalea lumnitzerae TaxID=2965509 RepID=A0ABQ5MI29_9FLAO|nr:aminotransferase class V-fold PLP-dependent enzyme [Neptunitalea sp. Y10]GLB49012.1 aminotransferase [Neptunitalea sp. Y10]